MGKITKGTLLAILVALLGAIGTGIFTASNDLMIQINWCAKDDPLCLLLHYAFFSVVLVVLAILTDGIIKRWPKIEKAWKKFIQVKVENLKLKFYRKGKIVYVRICNKEWRTPYWMVDLSINPENEKHEYKEHYWVIGGSGSLPVLRFKCLEHRLLEIDPFAKQFTICLEDSAQELEPFGVGVHFFIFVLPATKI